jgi:DNA-binding NarL/FixJ family response regulator
LDVGRSLRATGTEQAARDEAVDRGRAAYDRHEWANAYEQLSSAENAGPLDLDDLERLARAAQLSGQDQAGEAAWERAHVEAVRHDDPARAARCAFWLGLALMTRGEIAPAGGWFARGQRLLDEGRLDVPEQGYLLLPAAIQRLFSGDAATARDAFDRVSSIGVRFTDPDLTTLGRFGCGQSLVKLGQVAEGVALLDDAMVAVLAGEVSPIVAGVVYCGVIDACQSLFDLRRAREWSDALTSWCDAQPEMVPFQGLCLVHRAEMMRFAGDWSSAFGEIARAEDVPRTRRGEGVLAAAAYQKGELHRLRGEHDEAEEAYRTASEWGRDPQPGLALLRVAQGRAPAGAAAIRRVVAGNEPIGRAAVLAAHVEIMIEVEDLDAAKAGAEELAMIAAQLDAPFLHAQAAHAAGAVHLARGDAPRAMSELRRAARAWRTVDAPYETARTRVLIGVACGQIGDSDTAAMELEAARHVFEQLGAASDLQRLDELTGSRNGSRVGGLTGREVEVLQLVATGRTNREIAEELVISEKTVARHVANIFVKVGVSSRAAATAYAYRHGLA